MKEYVIAMEVYGKPASYDPSVDSFLRVDAARLRSKLVELPLSESSAGDPVNSNRKPMVLSCSFPPATSLGLATAASGIAFNTVVEEITALKQLIVQ